MVKKITPEFKEPLLPGTLLRVHDSGVDSGFYVTGDIVVVVSPSASQRADHDFVDGSGLYLSVISQRESRSRCIYSSKHESAKWVFALEVLEENDLSATDLLLLMEESTPQFREAVQNNGRLSSDD